MVTGCPSTCCVFRGGMFLDPLKIYPDGMRSGTKVISFSICCFADNQGNGLSGPTFLVLVEISLDRGTHLSSNVPWNGPKVFMFLDPFGLHPTMTMLPWCNVHHPSAKMDMIEIDLPNALLGMERVISFPALVIARQRPWSSMSITCTQ